MTPAPAAPVLVTGATGNDGTQVVELLLAAGSPVARGGLKCRGRPDPVGDRVPLELDFTAGEHPCQRIPP